MSKVSDQDRLMMQRRAQSAERRNRPRVLVVGAVFLCLVGGIYAAYGYSQRASALERYKSARLTQVNVQNQLERYQELSNPQSAGDGPVIHERMVSPISRLQQAAQNAEIEAPVFESERSEEDTGSVHRRIFRFNTFTVPDASDVVRWAQRVESEIEGMRVHSLEMSAKSDKRGWGVDISFSRLEKKQ